MFFREAALLYRQALAGGKGKYKVYRHAVKRNRRNAQAKVQGRKASASV